ncbi:Hypothetical protein NTJ_07615 [Nesidiocoris tenuis]|uniref:non-specific serine/threonine protein kinase n=1 Tax=Nesidiocoris tenuis TaxID=355587 RepID=A0ABN7ARH0_9HEMI|nr:Hypothetical protein NTJ_07615 [Nesidiocoris tenuis]
MDEYKKMRLIGQGSFGSVYEALDKFGRKAVLKEVVIAHLDDEKAHQARKEADLLKSLCHPNIIRYFNHWEAEGVLTIAMEYGRGGNLECFISKQKTHLEEIRALKIFVQILVAVEYLHRNGILHRDLSANNVLICDGDVIKVCDFGQSKRLLSVQSGSIAGNPSHLAPELCTGGKCSEESDMWALGCLLHHLLSLRRPFGSAGSIAQLLVSILTGPPPPLPRSFSKPLEGLIFSLLSSEPSARPKSSALLSHPLLALHVHRIHLGFSL